MRKTKEARAEGKHRKMTHCEGENGKKEERKKQRLSSKNRKRSGRKEADRKGKARKRKQKGSTGGTAVGAKPGGTKGNEQRAEYRNLEGKHEKSGWRERGDRGSESGNGHRESSCEAEPRREGKEETEAE